ncbi:MAG: carbohydrate kinase [Oscillospiraceae bacterium]|jgi:Sugar kinases, ribokinase family|nr:carbohydrate kinase [Oscillospiraceae bacterium]
MPDILTVGELLIDLTQTHVDEGFVRHFAANPGGAPANVAVAAAKLGASAGFVGKVGCDTFGADLRAVLERWGVETAGLYSTAEALTTQAVVSVAPSGERSFAFYRSPGADTLLTEEEVARAMGRCPKIVHFGSVSLTAEPARSATLAAARLGRAGGALVSYDPNYRANLWPDLETALTWMKKPLPMTDILKISDEELPLLTDTDEPERGSALLAELGIRLILITLGSKGVFYRMGGSTGTIPGIRVQVADTNGAGDTFHGALLSRLVLRGSAPLAGLEAPELEELLRFANRAAALTCTRSGAIPAMPTLEEVEAFAG